LEKIVGYVTTRFFPVSYANRQTGLDLGLYTPDKVTVIRCGVDLQMLKETRVDVSVKRRELGLDAGRPTIGMIAPFKPQKAPLDFVGMAEIVSRSRPDAQFLLVGDGELRGAIEAKCDELGVSKVVRLVGWRRDVPEILRCLDVFILTSLWEGLPRVYLEALASGVPVIGTRVDGAAEVVKNGVNGFLVEAGDVRSMAEKVLYLLAHVKESQEMGRRGQEITGEFDSSEMIRQQECEYETLLRAGTKGVSSVHHADGLKGA
jgi:glycosyltransferase involved in cell wall biosynthesis